MRSILDHCRDIEPRALAPGELLITEGEQSGRLFVLAEGALEVFRGDVEITLITEPGAIFGEMSILLDAPHTASVRALGAAQVHVIDDAAAFFRANPVIMLPIATLLARRLRNATDYLVNLKQQFQDQQNHLGMVDEVLESLAHQQDEGFAPVEDLPPEPPPPER